MLFKYLVNMTLCAGDTCCRDTWYVAGLSCSYIYAIYFRKRQHILDEVVKHVHDLKIER